jgi:uncharacterized membrane protein
MASTPWSPSPAQPPAPPAAAFELRPLSLGEILDRIFTVYRSRFWLFCGLMASPALIRIALAGVDVALAHFLRARATQATISLVTILLGYAGSLVDFLIFAVAQAALVYALYEIYQGRETTIAESLRAVSSHWLRYIGIGAWQIFTSAGPYALFALPGLILAARAGTGQDPTMAILGGGLILLGTFAGLPVGVILFLRNALAIPASTLEDLPVRAAMRRSKGLTRGAKGRLFVVLLVTFALYLVVGALEMPLLFVVVRATMRHQEALWAQAINLLISFLGISVVSPVGALGIALVYFDQRVRQEAWDLELLLGGSAAGTVPASAPVADTSWTPPAQSRFITSDGPQPEPAGGIYAALVAHPAPAEVEAPAPVAPAPGDSTSGSNGHAEGL